MASNLEFILKLTDMLSPGMRAAASISNTSAGQIESQFAKINTGGRRMSASVNELRGRLEAVNRVRFGTTIRSEFDTATRAAQRLESQIEKLQNKGSGKVGGGLTSMLGGLAAGAGAYQLGSMAIGGAATREQQQISFEVMTGSKSAGNKMLGDIVKMGANTPYESNDLIKNAEMLKAFGLANDKVLPSLMMMGDVARGNADKLGNLTLAFAQVNSAGKLTGQDLLQFINAGFNPLNEISKQTGLSMADLREKMEKGAISAKMIEGAFASATGPGGQFYQMMEKQSQTLAGRWSTFMDGAKEKLLTLGNILMPLVNKVLDFGTALMNGNPAALMFAGGIGVLALGIWGASAATGAWATIQGVLNTVMNANPIFRIISLILILGGIIYMICTRYEGWGKSMQGLWQIIKGFVSLNLIVWKQLGETIWYYIQFAWLKLKGFVEYTAGAFSNVFKALQLASQFKFAEAKQALFAEIKTTASGELAALEKKHSEGKLKNQQDAIAAITQMSEGYKMIGLKKKVQSQAPIIDINTGKQVPANPNTAFDGLGGNTGKERAASINSGGQKSIVIHIGKQIEKLEQNIYGGSTEAADNIEAAVREAMKKVINNINAVA